MKLSITLFAVVLAFCHGDRVKGEENSSAVSVMARYCSTTRLASFSNQGSLPYFPYIMDVSYLKTKAFVCLGNELNVSDVQYEPLVFWPSHPNKYYTLAMIDPDCPSNFNPRLSPYDHWLVGNIRGNDLTQADILSEYTPPNPSETTGLHRYYFLIHEQPNRLSFDEPRLPRDDIDDRFIFNYTQFLEKYDLRTNLVAGNYFIAQYTSKPKLKVNDNV